MLENRLKENFFLCDEILKVIIVNSSRDLLMMLINYTNVKKKLEEF